MSNDAKQIFSIEKMEYSVEKSCNSLRRQIPIQSQNRGGKSEQNPLIDHRSLKNRRESAGWKAYPISLDAPISKSAQDHIMSICNSLVWLSIITIQVFSESEEALQKLKKTCSLVNSSMTASRSFQNILNEKPAAHPVPYKQFPR